MKAINNVFSQLKWIGTAGVALAAMASQVQASNTTTLVAALRGGQEVPPVATPARGCGRFEVDINANTLKFHISYGGLTSPETAAHIHGPAGPGVNAGVVFPLPAGNPKVGVWNYPQAMEADILAGRMYVNIHTTQFPGGEIRGQVNSFAMDMDGMQENPAVTLPSQGWGTFNIDTCTNTLLFHIVVESLSGPETASHIHGLALHGTNAGVIFPLPGGMVKSSSWTYPESMERAILDGMTYANIHTAANPGGEIRGQIARTVAPMDAAQEVPPAPVPGARGCMFCSFDQGANTMGFYLTYAGLTGLETASHIHGFAPAGVNAGVLMPFAAGTPKKGTWAYGAANAANVFADLTYANIHTAAFPGGEIRGQIVVPLGKCIADTNCDGSVNVTDLLAIIAAWGPCPPAPALCPADINNSGDVNVADLLAVITGWGKCP